MEDRAPRPSRLWSTRTPRVATRHSPVSALVTRAPVCVEGSTTLGEAVDLMADAGVSSALVDGSAAIVTECEVTRALGAGLGRAEPVSAVATPEPTVVACDVTVEEAADVMLTRQLRHLVVDVHGQPAVVSIRDVLAAMAHHHGAGTSDRSSSDLWIG